MDSFENLFKIIIGVFGLVLTILKIVDLSNKSINKITTEINILEKTNELGIKNENLKEHIEKSIAKKYPELNIPRKRNWFIIILSFLLSCILFYLIINQTETDDFELSTWFLLQNFILSVFISIFWTALINRQD